MNEPPASSARLAVLESLGRHRAEAARSQAIFWGLLVVCHAPIWFDGQGFWLASVMPSLGACLAWGAGLPWLAHVLVPVFSAYEVYLAAASTAPSAWLAAAGAGVGLSALWVRPPRMAKTCGWAAMAIALALVWRILAHSLWPETAARLLALCTGLGFAGAALVATDGIVRGPSLARLTLALGCLGMTAAARQAGSTPDAAWALPGWRRSVALLTTSDIAPVPSAPALQALHHLRSVGARDAAEAWVGLGITQNATPAWVRAACPARGWSGVLPDSLSPVQRLGRRACTAVATHADTGVKDLLASPVPSLWRLAGDLLREAGSDAAAYAAFARAAAAAEPHAALDAALASMADGDAAAVSVRAFNAALQFDAMVPPRGYRLNPNVAVRSVFDMQLRRRIVLYDPAGTTAVLTFDLPPEAVHSFAVSLRRRGPLYIEVQSTNGHVDARGCEAPDPLPDDLCSGQWANIELRAGEADTALTHVVVHGRFAVAAARAQ